MRLDHLAFRVSDRKKTATFFTQAFNYKIQTEFDLQFDDGTIARCIALEPPEKINGSLPWTIEQESTVYHLAPEIFISDGDPGSIVGKWVSERNGIGGLHHAAYMVNSVQNKMNEWKEKGYAEFTTDKPLSCPDLVQCFTQPSILTGIIFEFIERGRHGFCQANVKDLMLSTVKTDNPTAIVQYSND